MRKLYPGMVPMKKNPQQQKAADNLAGKRAMLEAIHPMPKYEKTQREKVFMESQTNMAEKCQPCRYSFKSFSN